MSQPNTNVAQIMLSLTEASSGTSPERMRRTSLGINAHPFLILDKPALWDEGANSGRVPSPVFVLVFGTHTALTFVNGDRGSHIVRPLTKLLLFSALCPLFKAEGSFEELTINTSVPLGT